MDLLELFFVLCQACVGIIWPSDDPRTKRLQQTTGVMTLMAVVSLLVGFGGFLLGSFALLAIAGGFGAFLLLCAGALGLKIEGDCRRRKIENDYRRREKNRD